MRMRYYSPGEDRAAAVGRLFGTIAPRYDLVNDVQSLGLHRRWKRRVARLAAVKDGDWAADLCCGTGDIAFEMARFGARVVGLDFSGAMLDAALERRRRLLKPVRGAAGSAEVLTRGEPLAGSFGSVTFLLGDALALPFRDNQFDAVTMSYGLRNLADFRRGLGEMVRVLKPDKCLVILDFSRPRLRLWRAAYVAYLRWGLPVFGQIFYGDRGTYDYIWESLKAYPPPPQITAWMRAAGAERVQEISIGGGIMTIHIAVKRATPARADSFDV